MPRVGQKMGGVKPQGSTPTIIKPPSTSLSLPDGYQRFDYYKPGKNPNGVWLDAPATLQNTLKASPNAELYLYTHHEVFFQDGILKQTRSSPNWEGGLVTYCTCKHLMRTYNRDSWSNVWVAGLCPAKCANNTLMYVGRIDMVFEALHPLYLYLKKHHPAAFAAKRADTNPRGDQYTPKGNIDESLWHTHTAYNEPPNHTRSTEFYKASPGSVSTREDGKVPKWWRDLEYCRPKGQRPPVFTLAPVWLFSKPLLWCQLRPGRATLHITAGKLASSLRAA